MRSQGNCSMFLLLLLPIPHRGPRTTRPRTRKGREEERELRKTPASHSLLSWRKADATEQDAAFYWSNPHASWQAWAAFSIGLQSPLRGELLACPRRTVSRAGVADVRVGPDGGSRCWRECGAEGTGACGAPACQDGRGRAEGGCQQLLVGPPRHQHLSDVVLRFLHTPLQVGLFLLQLFNFFFCCFLFF